MLFRLYFGMIFLLSWCNVNAQTKIACINSKEVLKEMLQQSNCESRLKEYQDSLQNELLQIQKKLDDFYLSFIRCRMGEPPMPDSIKNNIREQTIAYVVLIQNKTEEFLKLTTLKVKQIEEDFLKIFKLKLQKIAAEQNYLYIIDSSAPSRLYVPTCVDITEKVMALIRYKPFT